MNGSSHSTRGSSAQRAADPIRKGILLGAIVVITLLLGVLLSLKSLFRRGGAEQPKRESPPEVAAVPGTKSASLSRNAAGTPKNSAPTRSKGLAVEPVSTLPGARPASQIMAELVELSESRGPITKEQAERFKQNLEELVRQGAASVPAIREFLQKNVDTDFANIAGADQLSYSSFRASLFDTLKQIGGLESQAAMVEALQTTALPAELLELAKDLDQAAPGLYRSQILKAAHQALDMAAAHQLGPDVELGPAFRILQSYGEANTTADLAKNDPSSFYNAIAMANLPDAQGLPSLIQMASREAGSGPDPSQQIIATEMIAQLASQNSQALETLVQMAQKGQIRNSVWEKLAPILGGDQYQLGGSATQNSGGEEGAAANQKYAVINSATTPDQINQRIALIDKFLGLVSVDSAAAAALQHQRGILSGKLSN
jgi:hypothetical protein